MASKLVGHTKLIKQRIWGQDCDFLAWVRDNPALPSREGETRLDVQDADTIFHAFMTSVDHIGTREIQAIMLVEHKTRNGRPDDAQRDTLWKLHQFSGQRIISKQIIRFFGVFVLIFSGTDPDNSTDLLWGRFSPDGNIRFSKISTEELIQLLLFKRHPMNLARQAFRRHHKTTELVIQSVAPLGFPQFEKVIRRS